jgi:hypothetical protein
VQHRQLLIRSISMRNGLLTAIIVAAVAAAFLGYTKPGHQLLYKAGFTAACDSSDGCSN